MQKYLISLVIALLTVYSLTSCGSSGGSNSTLSNSTPSDPMLSKDIIVVLYHSPAEECINSSLIDTLKAEIPEGENFIARVATNNVSCSTYNHINSIDCETNDLITEDPQFAQFKTSCVLGTDLKNAIDGDAFNNMALIKESALNSI